MTVAFVIPNRNNGRYIERCLKSVFEQTRQPAEVVIVDGKSTDDSGRTVQSLWKPGITRMISAEPNGIANARNVGVSAATSDMIVPLDADDWIEPKFVERCLERMTGSVGVVGTYLQWPDGRVQKPWAPYDAQAFLEGNRLFACSMFRRECWETVGGYDELPALYEDWLFWAKVACHGWKIDVVPEPLYRYCPHPGGSSAMMAAHDGLYRRNTISKLQDYMMVSD
jgi:glycosyltransferase involved in cell wall biosynthesis